VRPCPVATKSRRRLPRMSADAKRVASAEAALEAEVPTKRLSLEEAQRFVDHVAHTEDFDPPLVVYRKVRAKVDGLAVGDAHAIVVTSTTPSELTLLHELAHFIGGMDHGPRFREVYVGLVQRFVSREIAVHLQRLITSVSHPSIGG
jgi:hypothetical protein